MSGFWSTWVMLLIVVNLGITLFLFVWGLRVAIPTQPDGTSGHVWAHGVLREGVRRLPTWWIVLSGSAFVVCFSYLALYPGFGAFKGLLGWTSQNELALAQTANRALEAPLRQRIRGKSIESIAADPEVLRVGEVIFIDNCAACHGRGATGNHALGAPDLTDADSLYGSDGNALLASITNGRRGAMPAFSGGLTDDQIIALANYVASLSKRPHDALRAEIGRPLFSTCAACHGADGKGTPALGAPNLTDDTWLYGDRIADIAEAIRHGRNGEMPAWRTRLSAEDISLVAAWVYARSHPAATR